MIQQTVAKQGEGVSRHGLEKRELWGCKDKWKENIAHNMERKEADIIN